MNNSDTGNGWYFFYGYHQENNSCVKVNLPANAFLGRYGNLKVEVVTQMENSDLNDSGKGWHCEHGYAKTNNSYVALVAQKNVHIDYSDWAWSYDPGYQQQDELCLPR